MVKNPDILYAFEKALAREETPDHANNLRVFEALFEEACRLGVFPLKEPLEGIEVDIRVARALNVRTSA